MACLPGLTKDAILQSIQEERFDHICAIYNLLLHEKLTEQESPSPTYFTLHHPVQRKASITTGVVERVDPQMPEIHLFLNDSQIYEKVKSLLLLLLFSYNFPNNLNLCIVCDSSSLTRCV